MSNQDGTGKKNNKMLSTDVISSKPFQFETPNTTSTAANPTPSGGFGAHKGTSRAKRPSSSFGFSAPSSKSTASSGSSSGFAFATPSTISTTSSPVSGSQPSPKAAEASPFQTPSPASPSTSLPLAFAIPVTSPVSSNEIPKSPPRLQQPSYSFPKSFKVPASIPSATSTTISFSDDKSIVAGKASIPAASRSPYSSKTTGKSFSSGKENKYPTMPSNASDSRPWSSDSILTDEALEYVKSEFEAVSVGEEPSVDGIFRTLEISHRGFLYLMLSKIGMAFIYLGTHYSETANPGTVVPIRKPYWKPRDLISMDNPKCIASHPDGSFYFLDEQRTEPDLGTTPFDPYAAHLDPKSPRVLHKSVIRQVSLSSAKNAERVTLQTFGMGKKFLFIASTGSPIVLIGICQNEDTGSYEIRMLDQRSSTSTPLTSTDPKDPREGNVWESYIPSPTCIALSPLDPGLYLVSSSPQHYISSLDTQLGKVSIFAGVPEKSGKLDGPASIALFNKPASLCFTLQGHLLVSDTKNQCIRMITMDMFVKTFSAFRVDGQDLVAPTPSDHLFPLACHPQGGYFVGDCETPQPDVIHGQINYISPSGEVLRYAGMTDSYAHLIAAQNPSMFDWKSVLEEFSSIESTSTAVPSESGNSSQQARSNSSTASFTTTTASTDTQPLSPSSSSPFAFTPSSSSSDPTPKISGAALFATRKESNSPIGTASSAMHSLPSPSTSTELSNVVNHIFKSMNLLEGPIDRTFIAKPVSFATTPLGELLYLDEVTRVAVCLKNKILTRKVQTKLKPDLGSMNGFDLPDSYRVNSNSVDDSQPPAKKTSTSTPNDPKVFKNSANSSSHSLPSTYNLLDVGANSLSLEALLSSSTHNNASTTATNVELNWLNLTFHPESTATRHPSQFPVSYCREIGSLSARNRVWTLCATFIQLRCPSLMDASRVELLVSISSTIRTSSVDIFLNYLHSDVLDLHNCLFTELCDLEKIGTCLKLDHLVDYVRKRIFYFGSCVSSSSITTALHDVDKEIIYNETTELLDLAAPLILLQCLSSSSSQSWIVEEMMDLISTDWLHSFVLKFCSNDEAISQCDKSALTAIFVAVKATPIHYGPPKSPVFGELQTVMDTYFEQMSEANYTLVSSLESTKYDSDDEGTTKKKKAFSCHQWVLWSKWEWFRTALAFGGTEFSSKSLELPFSNSLIEGFLHYLYTGRCSKLKNIQDCTDLIANAALFQLTRPNRTAIGSFHQLITHCRMMTFPFLTRINCIPTLMNTLQHGDDLQIQTVRNYIAANAFSFCKYPSFSKQMSHLPKSELARIYAEIYTNNLEPGYPSSSWAHNKQALD